MTVGEDKLIPVFRALERFDYGGIGREIDRLASSHTDPRDFVHQAALPLMRTVGERWHQGKCSIAQEHMLTRQLTAFLSALIQDYRRATPPARILIATPRNELHEFPILAAAMLAVVGGLGVVYTGSDLPAADIVLAANRTDAVAVLLSLSTVPGAETLGELSHIARALPRSTALWLGGPQEISLEGYWTGSRWVMLHDFFSLEKQYATLGGWFGEGRTTRQPG
jgi:MerR family transcriptional regulator, light-induced transcriptional regulator